MPPVALEIVVSHAGEAKEIQLSLPAAVPVRLAIEQALYSLGIDPKGVTWTVRLGNRVLDQSRPLSAIAEGPGAVRLHVAVQRDIFEEDDFDLDDEGSAIDLGPGTDFDLEVGDPRADDSEFAISLDESDSGEMSLDDDGDRPPNPAAPARPPGFVPPAPTFIPPKPTSLPQATGAKPATPTVGRHATVRYYGRMNPAKVFPLLVFLSEDTILDAAKRGARQGRSGRFDVGLGERLEAEPILPGCFCYPPRASLRVAPGEVSAGFYVMPHVLGKLMEPRVVLRRDGEVLAEVPLDIRVSKQTTAILSGALGLLLPFGVAYLKQKKLDVESQMGEGFGIYVGLARRAASWLSPDAVGLTLLAAAVVLYLVCRPRRKDAFREILTVGPGEQLRMAGEAFDRGDDDAGEELIGSLLRTHPDFEPARRYCGDRLYGAGEYAEALVHYKECMRLGSAQPEVYSRAADSALRSGDPGRAYGFLKVAEAQLSEGAMTPVMHYNLGCYAAREERHDEAITQLRISADRGYRDPEVYRNDPDLASLRGRADFQRLLDGL